MGFLQKRTDYIAQVAGGIALPIAGPRARQSRT